MKTRSFYTKSVLKRHTRWRAAIAFNNAYREIQTLMLKISVKLASKAVISNISYVYMYKRILLK